MKEYLLGIDLGTSGTKTVLFRSDGTAMAAHTVEYPLYQPQNGWAEQEPSDWWRAVRETVQAVLHKSGVAAADVEIINNKKIKSKNEEIDFNAYVVHANGNIRTEVRSRKRTGDHGFYA